MVRLTFGSTRLLLFALALAGIVLCCRADLARAQSLSGQSTGAIFTDGARWSAYANPDGDARLIDASTLVVTAITPPGGGTCAPLVLGAGRGLFACTRPGQSTSSTWEVVDLAHPTQAPAPVPAVPEPPPGDEPLSATAIGRQWIEFAACGLHSDSVCTNFFLNWHTAQQAQATATPTSSWNLDHPYLSIGRPPPPAPRHLARRDPRSDRSPLVLVGPGRRHRVLSQCPNGCGAFTDLQPSAVAWIDGLNVHALRLTGRAARLHFRPPGAPANAAATRVRVIGTHGVLATTPTFTPDTPFAYAFSYAAWP